MRKLKPVYLAALLLVAALAFTAAIWPAAAAWPAAADAVDADYIVEYEMSLNNVVVSTERSMIVHDDLRIIISSETEMTAPQPLKMRNMLIINNFTMRPEAYYLEAEVRGAIQKLDATFAATQCQYRAEHATGVQNGTINLPENYLVWENNVWIQLMYLVSGVEWEQGAVAGAGGTVAPIAPGAFKAQVLIPTTMSLLNVTIEDRGLEKVTIEGAEAGATLQARRVALNFGGTLIMDAWLDLETRIPLKISIPAQKLLVVRKSLTLIDPSDPAAEEDLEAEEDLGADEETGAAEEVTEGEQEEPLTNENAGEPGEAGN